MKLLATACLVLFSAVAPAVAVAQGMGNLSSIAVMAGQCSTLVVADEEMTAQCEAKVINTAYRNGKSSFTFVAGDKLVVGFFGADSRAKGNEATLKVESITLNKLTGGPSTSTPAKGSCTYTNPYVSPSRVQCSAKAGGKTYTGAFLSDGQKPTVATF